MRQPGTIACHGRWSIGTVLLVALSVFLVRHANAEATQVRIAYQFGFQYIPTLIMKHDHLVEKYAKTAGLGDVEVIWMQLSAAQA